MIARRLSLVIMTIAASLAWMGCLPAVEPPDGNQEGRPLVQGKPGARVVQSMKASDASIRVSLLMAETVQTDLGLTADQIGKIRVLVETGERQLRDFLAKSREILPPSRHFSPGEAQAREREFWALLEDFTSKNKEFKTKALAVLTPSQSERLKQIQLQAAGPDAMVRPEIIGALGISDGQLAKIRELRDQMYRRLSADWPDVRGLNGKERRQKDIEFMKKSDQAKAEATKRVLDLLTPKQRTAFDKLQGKKIDLTPLYDVLIPEDTEF